MKKLTFLLLSAALAAPACSGESNNNDGDDDPTPVVPDAGVTDEWDELLGNREYDYSAALKIAALRLTGDVPTLAEINQVASAPAEGKAAAYQAIIRTYLERPAFAKQMMSFWRDTFKMGGTAELDAAPAFAAQLTVENRSYMELFTATQNTCPTYDAAAGTFTAANCPGTGPVAGVITNPGAMKHFFGNFAFRRVRWVQESFDCVKFPAEVGAAQDVGGAAPFLGVWPFKSISGLDTGRVDFQDVSAVVCANCHQTMNHIAPLFANYDANGAYQAAISVPTPLEGAPMAQLNDYLPAGESTAWRFGVPADSLTALGTAMAADPDVAKCGVARVWNWALGKTDIVDTLQEVPIETIQTQVDAFTASGHKLKDLVYAVYTSDDFVQFLRSTP
jgi:hypothetical protein